MPDAFHVLCRAADKRYWTGSRWSPDIHEARLFPSAAAALLSRRAHPTRVTTARVTDDGNAAVPGRA